MHRRAIINLLHDYSLKYPGEQETIDRYKRFVHDYADCFERSQLAGHVTGSAWLVNSAGTHVLLTHHKKLNQWLQLGGHADGNPDAGAVALREAQEESGIDNIEPLYGQLFDVDIHKIPARAAEPEHYHYDARFALRVTGSDDFTVSEESHALEWIDIDKLRDRTTENSMLRMAGKWRESR